MSDIETWNKRTADGRFLVESGLLYMINREILHPVGLALTVNKEGGILIKGPSLTPEKLLFSRDNIVNGYTKFKKFMQEFGNSQMDRRTEYLGWCTQPQIYGEK